MNDESQFRNAGTHYGNAESWERDSSKEINGSWFEHGRLRMEGDYKLGLEAKQPKRVHSTRQGIHTYTYIYILADARHLLAKHPSFVSRSKSPRRDTVFTCTYVLEMTRNRHLRDPP